MVARSGRGGEAREAFLIFGKARITKATKLVAFFFFSTVQCFDYAAPSSPAVRFLP
jgi:hypothetical protein